MNFGQAIEELKQGNKVARSGWNGKGMFLFIINGGNTDHPALSSRAVAMPYIAMYTADSKVVPWLASQTDMLADDWEIVQ